MIVISKKNIYKGQWWYNKRRKHPSIIIKSNNLNYFEVRLLSHKRYNCDDFVLKISPNPNGDNAKQFINKRTIIENNKNSFGIHLTRYKLSNFDKRRFKRWKRNKK